MNIKIWLALITVLSIFLSASLTSSCISQISTGDEQLFPNSKVIDIKITINTDDYSDILKNAVKEEFKIASINYNGMKLQDIGIRTKGNSSLNMVSKTDSERYSYKLDFGQFTNNQTLQGVQSISLNNCFADPTYMREYLAYSLFKDMGVMTPRCSYANLYINNRLIGLYLAVENINEEFISRSTQQSKSTLYKPDGIGSDLSYHGDSIKKYPGLVNKSDNNTGNHQKILDMIHELNNGSDFEKYIDVDHVLRYLAVSTAISNLDSYQGISQHNYYIYDINGVFSIIPWDLNMSFGSFTMGIDAENMTTILIDEPTAGNIQDWPLISKLISNTEYRDKYHSYIKELISGPLSEDQINRTVDDIQSLITPYVQSQNVSFFTFEEYSHSFINDIDAATGNIPGLLPFISARVANINDQINGKIPSYLSGKGLSAEMPPRGKDNSPSTRTNTFNDTAEPQEMSRNLSTGIDTPQEARPDPAISIRYGSGIVILFILLLMMVYKDKKSFH